MISENISKDEKMKQDKTKTAFDDLKCNYILQDILSHMKKTKYFEIIKYNKKLQNRINLSFKDYKDYCQLYTDIIVELTPLPFVYKYGGRFINIWDEQKKYFHIYFDDSNEEIKRNYIEKSENIKKIKIVINYQVKSFKELFAHVNTGDCIGSIVFKKFYRTNITDMSRMFYYRGELKEIDFSNFNTDNVTDMSQMFIGCFSLKELNLSNFNTNNVTNMGAMFSQCSYLKNLNISNFNTNNVTDMGAMFSGCSSLNELNISNFNTNNVTNMCAMFSRCSSLEELNLSNFNTNNVTNMKFMFQECSSLKELNISNFNTKNVTDMNKMFRGCKLLKELNLTKFNIDKATDMNYMFDGCPDELKNKVKLEKESSICILF